MQAIGNHHAGAALPRPRDRATERNAILRLLPAPVYDGLQPHLYAMDLPARHVLCEPGAPVEALYFPRTCVVSHLVVLETQPVVEAGTVGCEGAVGLPAVLGVESAALRSMVQVAGAVAVLPLEAFRELQQTDGMLTALLLRYAQGLHEQTAQSVACNRRHSLVERCARWLLMTHDRVHGDELLLTQEYLAAMLGVRRAGVSEAAGALQRQGVIRYSRGRLAISDRAGLEAQSCECYQVVRDRNAAILGAVT